MLIYEGKSRKSTHVFVFVFRIWPNRIITQVGYHWQRKFRLYNPARSLALPSLDTNACSSGKLEIRHCPLSLPPPPFLRCCSRQPASLSLSPAISCPSYVSEISLYSSANTRSDDSLARSLSDGRTEESHIHEESKYEKSFQEPQSLATGWSQGLTCYNNRM